MQCMRLHFCMVQFDLFNTPRGFAIFYLLVAYCQPRARGRRNFPTPELLTDLIHVRFLGYIFLRRIMISVQ